MIRTTRIMKRTTILWVLISLLLIPAFSEARVISVQMSAPTIAFGGFSWPGVGQYEKITGVAYAEVDPADRRNAIIVDIGLAETQAAPGQPGKTPSGKVGYLLNFYILKPVNLSQVDRKLNGYGKTMYEPPNRGGKTWAALGRIVAGPGGANDPASIVDQTVLANSFLMPRGYTLVWSGWEPLVPVANLGNQPPCVGRVADCRKPRWLNDHRSGLRIHRKLGHFVHLGVSGGHRRQERGDVDASRSPRRCTGNHSRLGLGIHRREPHGDPPASRGNLRRQRHL